MGNIILGLIGKEALITKSLIGCIWYAVSLNKLREYYSTIQNLLKSVTMNSEEFEETFKCRCFSIWDIDNNGVIGVFEVLAGLTMISKASARDKFQCKFYAVLFNLFDFNNEDSITVCDLQVLFHLSVLSVCKIFGHFKDISPHEAIELTAGFRSDVKINLNVMLEFCLSNQTVLHFLSVCERLSHSNQSV
jgi:hypothetical protein